jgi:hypothetical protein
MTNWGAEIIAIANDAIHASATVSEADALDALHFVRSLIVKIYYVNRALGDFAVRHNLSSDPGEGGSSISVK